VLSEEATNTNVIVFDLTRLKFLKYGFKVDRSYKGHFLYLVNKL
jgi:hypothetical protein